MAQYHDFRTPQQSGWHLKRTKVGLKRRRLNYLELCRIQQEAAASHFNALGDDPKIKMINLGYYHDTQMHRI